MWFTIGCNRFQPSWKWHTYNPQRDSGRVLHDCVKAVRRLSPLDCILIGKLDQHCRPINTPSLLSPTQLIEEDNSMSVLKAVWYLCRIRSQVDFFWSSIYYTTYSYIRDTLCIRVYKRSYILQPRAPFKYYGSEEYVVTLGEITLTPNSNVSWLCSTRRGRMT